MRLLGTVAVGLLAAALTAACTPVGSGPSLRLENATDIPVAVHVNGSWVGTYPAGAIRDVPVSSDLPAGIEILTPTGAVLAEWSVDDQAATAGDVTVSEVPCGVIRLSVGPAELPALDPPPPIGTCP